MEEHKGSENKKRTAESLGQFADDDNKLVVAKKLKMGSTSQHFTELLSEAMAAGSWHKKVMSVMQLSSFETIHDVGGIYPIFDCMLPWIMQPKLKDQDAHFLLKVMDKVMLCISSDDFDRDQIRPFVPKIIVATQPFMFDGNMKAKDIIYNLTKIVGLDSMLAVIELQMNDYSEYVREVAAKTVGIVTSTLGIPEVLPFVACYRQGSNVPLQARRAALKTIEQIAILAGHALRPYLEQFMSIVGEEVDVATISCQATLARAVAPFGFEFFRPILHGMFCPSGGGAWSTLRREVNVMTAIVKLTACVIPCMMALYVEEGKQSPRSLGQHVECGVSVACSLLKKENEETEEIALEAIKAFARVKNVRVLFMHDSCCNLMGYLWGRRGLKPKGNRLLAETIMAVANMMGAVNFRRRVIKELKDYSEEYKLAVLEIIKKMLDCEKALDSDSDADADAKLQDVVSDMTYLFCSSL